MKKLILFSLIVSFFWSCHAQTSVLPLPSLVNSDTSNITTLKSWCE